MAAVIRRKDYEAVQAGVRIKQARQMAGFRIQADLNEILISKYGWSTGRLGNYESGQTYPGPGEFRILAVETGTSECWLAFGAGPIRSRSRDLQAIRHQNLVHCVNSLQSSPGAYSHFLEQAGTNPAAIRKYLDNPFRKVGDRQVRRFERALDKKKGWLDEQHIDHE
jgi:transcriptional regulator with XRE-family HTH domain